MVVSGEHPPAAAAPAVPAPRPVRRVAVGLLVVLYAVGGLASVVGVWSSRTLLDTERFTATVVSTIDTPEVGDAIASSLVDQVLLVASERRVVADRVPDELEPFLPLLVAAVRPAVEDQVSEVLRSDHALDALAASVARAHGAVMAVLRSDDPFRLGPLRVDDERVVLDLSSLIVMSLDGLVERGVLPERFALDISPDSTTAVALRAALVDRLDVDVPDTFGTVVVFESEAVARAGAYVSTGRRALATYERAIAALVLTTVALAVAAVALSEHRRRTGVHLGLATAAVGVTTVLLARRALASVPALIDDPEARRAAVRLVASVSSGLVRISELLILLGVLVLVAGWLSGPSPVGRSLRGRIERAGGLREAVVTHPDAVRLAGVATIAAILLWLDWSALTASVSAAIAATVVVAPIVAASRAEPPAIDP
jgi:hypothetical protein